MSDQYPGGWLTKSPPTPNGSTARGMWKLNQQAGYRQQNLWPTAPNAPTIGTASATSGTVASVTFTAPANTGSSAITGYTVTASPGGLTGTGSASPVSVSGLTAGTSYTFTVTATNAAGTGPASAASNSITMPVNGQVAYTTPGTYSWVAPAGVTSVSVVAVGGGDRWQYKWLVDDLSPEQIAANIEKKNQKLRADIVTKTQARLDNFASSRNYAGMLSLCTYATSTNAKFAAEGQYGVQARDETWAKLYEILAEVEAGTRPVPTGYAEIEPELPALAWP